MPSRITFARIVGILFGLTVGAVLTKLFITDFRWWAACVGAVLGGIVADVVLNAGLYRAGINRAWHETTNWRPRKAYWLHMGLCMVGYGAATPTLFITIVLGLLCLGWAVPNHAGFYGFLKSFIVIAWGSMVLGAMFGILCGLMFGSRLSGRDTDDAKYEERLRTQSKLMLWLAREYNPVSASIWLARFLGVTVANMPQIAFAVGSFLGRTARIGVDFVKCIVQYTHTESRAIVMMHVALGVLVGAAMDYSWWGYAAGLAAGLGVGFIHDHYLSPRLLAWATTVRR